MQNKNFTISNEIYDYVIDASLRETVVLRRLREETYKDPKSVMQISPDQGQFLSLVVKLIKATKVLEIGVYTGYSSLCIAQALPENGKIIACDINEEWTTIAQRYWKEAEVEKKIDLRLAPALNTLKALLQDGSAETFDFIFIDADKENLINYYEHSLQLLKVGGLIAIDNVLWSGKVLDTEAIDKETLTIKEFNKKIHNDNRVELSMLTISDGVTLALKK